LCALLTVSMEDWLWYAVAAMLLLAAANLSLKTFVKDYSLPQGLDYGALALVLLGSALLGLGCIRLLGLDGSLLQTALLVVMFSLAGFACVVLALQGGKVALVTAVLSMSTVVVALASVQLFGDNFSVKEALALAFSVIALLALVI